MRISATYAGRSDLSALLKWRFTLEDRLAHNRAARAFHRHYVPIEDYVGATSFFLALVPLLLAGLWKHWAERMFGGELGDDACLVVFLIALCVGTYLHTIGLILLVCLLPFLLWLWFGVVMREHRPKPL